MGGALVFGLVAAGVVLAFAGAELCARGLSALGRGAFAALGAVAAALAASLPEVLFAARAQADGSPDLALGLVAGSLIANALIAAPLAASGARERADRTTQALGLWTALGVAAVLLAAADGVLVPLEGAVLVLGAVIAGVLTATRRRDDDGRPRQAAWLSAIGLISGAALLALGTVLAVDAAAGRPLGGVGGPLATGLVVFGLAAALPEITAAAFAARRGDGRAALGAVIAGTAITSFGAIGAAALVGPLPVESSFMRAPAAAMIGSAVLLALLAFAGGRLPRWTPVAGVVLYVGVVAGLVLAPW